jgi:1-acyl-sn-glycerol-3-phosphate acyltransferase
VSLNPFHSSKELPPSARWHPARYLLYPLRPLGRAVIRRRVKVRIVHGENLPRKGPVIVACNHVGVADGPLVAIFAPRPVHALTKEEMFSGPLGAFLRWSGQIPLDRFRADTRAVRTAVAVLREGHCVGVFPEGTRGPGDLQTFHPGAAYLAMVTGAPVVPLTFLGTRLPGGRSSSLPPKRAHVQIVVGEPMVVDAVSWPRKRENVRLTSAALHAHMRAGLAAALEETGRRLPGPLPQGDTDE